METWMLSTRPPRNSKFLSSYSVKISVREGPTVPRLCCLLETICGLLKLWFQNVCMWDGDISVLKNFPSDSNTQESLRTSDTGSSYLSLTLARSGIMYGCESLTIKKSKCLRINAFELWCWRRLFTNWAMREAPWRRLLRVLGLQGDLNSQSSRKLALNVHWKEWCWDSNFLATWCVELTHWKRPWCWERLKAGEGDNRVQDGWMASPTWRTWVLVNSGSWWWTGRPVALQFTKGLQRAGHGWVTELRGAITWGSFKENAVWAASPWPPIRI